MSLPSIYSSSSLCYLPLLAPDIIQHTIMRLPTIYSFSPLCYIQILAPDITLSTLLSVSPQYTVFHPSDTFHIWPQISLSAPYYQSPQNIKFFTPVLPSTFGPRYIYQIPIISLPTIYSSSPLCYVPLFATDITLSTLLSDSQQYKFFTPLLPSTFDPKFHSQHPIISLPTIYSFSTLCYLPRLDPDINLSTLLSVSTQYTVIHLSVTFHFWHQISISAPYYESPHNIKFFTLCYLPILAPDITLSTLP